MVTSNHVLSGAFLLLITQHQPHFLLSPNLRNNGENVCHGMQGDVGDNDWYAPIEPAYHTVYFEFSLAIYVFLSIEMVALMPAMQIQAMQEVSLYH